MLVENSWGDIIWGDDVPIIGKDGRVTKSEKKKLPPIRSPYSFDEMIQSVARSLLHYMTENEFRTSKKDFLQKTYSFIEAYIVNHTKESKNITHYKKCVIAGHIAYVFGHKISDNEPQFTSNGDIYDAVKYSIKAKAPK